MFQIALYNGKTTESICQSTKQWVRKEEWNNACVSIPSYQCQPGDVISVKESPASKQLVTRNLEIPALSNVPQNLDFNKKDLTAKVLGIIDREWIALKLNELFVVEYYSRKI